MIPKCHLFTPLSDCYWCGTSYEPTHSLKFKNPDDKNEAVVSDSGIRIQQTGLNKNLKPSLP